MALVCRCPAWYAAWLLVRQWMGMGNCGSGWGLWGSLVDLGLSVVTGTEKVEHFVGGLGFGMGWCLQAGRVWPGRRGAIAWGDGL
ncbi:hypothetical protein DPMN_104928 [Dreissena polymorpha]|uniref:Uncharacterized protein n=1 Tax=Dreissena polymorpha TaxID=45954 RepID=A0A9D4HCW8_DREPO|nr:hypothetical protein DPMN_104928 [Dreissena polymorpha]